MRRLALLAALALGLCGSAFASFSLVNSGSSQSGGATCSITSASLTSGNFIVAVCSSDFGSGQTCSFSSTNETWTAQNTNFSTSSSTTSVYTAPVTTNSTNEIISASFSNSANFQSCAYIQYSTSTGSISVDQVASGNSIGATTSLSSNSVTTTVASELLVGVFGLHASGGFTYTAGSGYTKELVQDGSAGTVIVMEDQSVSSTGSYTATATSSSNISDGGGFLVTLKASGGSTCPKTLSTLGVGC